MPNDAMLDRLRAALAALPVTEQKMFGGTCFMLAGNMLLGTSKRGLLVRVGKEDHAAALKKPHTRPMEMGGREMQGYLFVDPAGTSSSKDLDAWIGCARAFVETLPPKAGKTKATKQKRLRTGTRR